MRESVVRYFTHQAGALALAAALATTLSLVSANAGGPSGAARAIDGDTLAIGDVRVRLEGIDAPEAAQRCGRRWLGTWECGRAATARLSELIDRQEVRCDSHGHDSYGRVLGVCFVGSQEINAVLVREGLAWAFLKYSRRYEQIEAEARVLRVGIWQGETEPAWSYRQRHWVAAEGGAPKGCAIKGNVTREGRIYHMPWSPWYEKTRVDERRGERWFCSEADAVAAGWRPAIVR
jgi:endonuclease YncB( thermonuclease family)